MDELKEEDAEGEGNAINLCCEFNSSPAVLLGYDPAGTVVGAQGHTPSASILGTLHTKLSTPKYSKIPKSQ